MTPVLQRRLPAAAVLVALLVGCAGPQEPLDVSIQRADVGIILGQRKVVEHAPVGPVVPSSPTTLPPTFAAPEPSVFPSAPPPPDPGPCPSFDPVAPVLGASTSVDARPVPARYTYRGLIASVAGATNETFAGDSVWEVGQSSAPNALGDYTFDVSVTAGKLTSTRTFLVVGGEPAPSVTDPTGTAPPPPPLPPSPHQPGLYISKVVRTDGTSFAPANPMPIALFQVTTGHSFRYEGSDAGTTLSYLATVKPRAKVNACGTPLEGWVVELREGRITWADAAGQTFSADFAETLTIGTQFGGLLLADKVEIKNNVNPLNPVTRTEDFTISQQPALPRAGA